VVVVVLLVVLMVLMSREGGRGRGITKSLEHFVHFLLLLLAHRAVLRSCLKRKINISSFEKKTMEANSIMLTRLVVRAATSTSSTVSTVVGEREEGDLLVLLVVVRMVLLMVVELDLDDDDDDVAPLSMAPNTLHHPHPPKPALTKSPHFAALFKLGQGWEFQGAHSIIPVKLTGGAPILIPPIDLFMLDLTWEGDIIKCQSGFFYCG
jgi:hypothetical protein